MKQQTRFKQTEIGKIPEDWKTDVLSNHIEIIGGGTPKTTVKNYWNGNIPWISVVDFGRDRKWIYDTEKHITKEGLENSSTKLLKKGQIIISARGTVGELGQVTKDMAFNQSCYGLSGKKEMDNDYLYYLLKQKVKEFEQKGHGAVFNTITTKTFSQIIIPIINLGEQKAIAKILSDLDAKIELNKKMNKTIELIGQSLFKKWFIDEKKSSWKQVKLGDFIFVQRGLSYKGSGLSEKGIPMINLGNIAPDNHFRYDGLKFYSGEYKERNLVKPGDLIIANTDITQKREVLGSCLIVPSDLGIDKILFTHHIYAIRNKEDKQILPKHFLSYLLQTPEFRERATGFATGTTVLALPEDAILDFTFDIPDKDLLEKFDYIIDFMKKRSANNYSESKKLSQIRDSLLPKLMSGEIRVK